VLLLELFTSMRRHPDHRPMRHVLSLGLALAALGLAPVAGHAARNLCKRTATFFMPPPPRSKSPRSETEGWTRIVPGECQVARKDR